MVLLQGGGGSFCEGQVCRGYRYPYLRENTPVKVDNIDERVSAL